MLASNVHKTAAYTLAGIKRYLVALACISTATDERLSMLTCIHRSSVSCVVEDDLQLLIYHLSDVHLVLRSAGD